MIEKIKKIVGQDFVKENEPLSKISSIKIGGKCKALIMPQCYEDLFNLLDLFLKKRTKYKVVGNATNILFNDEKVESFIVLTKNLNGLNYTSGGSVWVGAGFSLGQLAFETAKMGLSGLEFAAGIPGTIGGAIKMNAGAFGGSISSVVESVTIYDNGVIRSLDKKDLGFGYRSSVFQSLCCNAIILYAELKLEKCDKNEVLNKLFKFVNERKLKQPTEPSLGSVFKNAESIFAGKVIDELGFKGKTIGGAVVSSKHANFIVNHGGATFKDVVTLVNLINCEIEKSIGKQLKLEIEIYK